MAPKTTKKTVTKPVEKKATVKKIPAKKVAPKTAPAAHECGCGHNCHCHGHHGCKFSHVLKKIIVFIVIFALGFAAAKFVPCGKKHHPRMPKPQFENGCLVVDSIKCPKLLEQLPVIDADANGCVTKDEFRAAKRAFAPRHHRAPDAQ